MTPTIPSSETIQRFFSELLYPDARDGWLVLSWPDATRLTRQGKPVLRSGWFDLSQASWPAIAHAAAMRAKDTTVYFGVALQHPSCTPSEFARSKNATAYVVPGLWFDLDLAYGQHAASQLPATDDDALTFLATLPAPPSLVVHSGGGLYGYWLFKEPYTIDTDDERDTCAHLAKQFAYTLTTWGKDRGWTLDALGDLARVLRPPGTINHKYGKPVTVVCERDVRYNPGEFDWLLDLPRPAHTTHNGTAISGQPDLLTVAAHYGTVFTEKSPRELASAHPHHGSSTGDNFNVNPQKQLWHCWRHGTGGDALTLIAICEGLLACEQAIAGALSGALFQRVVTIANAMFQGQIALHTGGEAFGIQSHVLRPTPTNPWRAARGAWRAAGHPWQHGRQSLRPPLSTARRVPHDQ
jgi:hypothetical protein